MFPFNQKFTAACLIVLFLVFYIFIFLSSGAAAQGDLGLGGLEETELVKAPATQLAARIINAFLGILGLIAVIVIIYAGYVWMTAGGNEERVAQAKKILLGAVVGLIIILASFAIVRFVISRVTGREAAPTGQVGGVGPGGVGGLPAGAFLVKNIQPAEDQTSPRNTVVRILLNRTVDPESIQNSDIKVSRADTEPAAEIPGELTLKNSLTLEFRPSAFCEELPRLHCLPSLAKIHLEIQSQSIASADGRQLNCGNGKCVRNFNTSDKIDLEAPAVRIIAPQNNDSVSADSAVELRAQATDDSGVGLVEFYVDNELVDSVAPEEESQNFEAVGIWETFDLTLGSQHTIRARAYDLDDQQSSSQTVTVKIRAAHCFNNIKDRDETGIDCGGTECLTCGGENCRNNNECSSGICVNGVCPDYPLITDLSPRSGAPGSYLSIQGNGFGSAVGTVVFLGEDTDGDGQAEGDRDDTAAPVPQDCASGWRNNQVIVVVPNGAASGPLKLVEGSTGQNFWDRTDDRRGFRGDFTVNDILKPGICSVEPNQGKYLEPVAVSGVNFGVYQAGDEIYFGNTPVRGEENKWTPSVINTLVPNLRSGLASLKVKAAGIFSNSVRFKILRTGQGRGGDSCETGEDCLSGVCQDGACESAAGDDRTETEDRSRPVIPAGGPQCTFSWSFTTKAGNPDGGSCTEDNQCQSGRCEQGVCVSSEFLRVIETVPSCASACVNAQIGARFNHPLDLATANKDNVLLYKCTTKKCKADERELIDSSKYTLRYQLIEGYEDVEQEIIYADQYWLYFSQAPIESNTTYRVVFKDGDNGLKSDQGTVLMGLNYKLDLDWSDSYSWTFKTKAGQCEAQRVAVSPNPASGVTLTRIGQGQHYSGMIYSAPDQCSAQGQALDPYDYSWSWSSSNTQTADFDPFLGLGEAEYSSLVESGSDAVIEQIRNSPYREAVARGAGETYIGAQTQGLSDQSLLKVNTTFPYLLIEERIPNCASACANALIGARFNHPVDAATVTNNNIQLFRCETGECGADKRERIDPAAYRLSYQVTKNANNEDQYWVHLSGASIEFGTSYRILFIGGENGVKSADGKELKRLNYKFNPQSDGRDSYSWVFKTKATPMRELCAGQKVEIAPATPACIEDKQCRASCVDGLCQDVVLNSLDQSQNYNVSIYSAPDECSSLGQALDPNKDIDGNWRNWQWSSSEMTVADFEIYYEQIIRELETAITDFETALDEERGELTEEEINEKETELANMRQELERKRPELERLASETRTGPYQKVNPLAGGITDIGVQTGQLSDRSRLLVNFDISNPNLIGTDPLLDRPVCPNIAKIGLVFDQLLNYSTINSRTVILEKGNKSIPVQLVITDRDSDGNRENDQTIVAIQPQSLLGISQMYSVHLTDGIQNKFGMALDPAVSVNFSTKNDYCVIDHIDVEVKSKDKNGNDKSVLSNEDSFTCAGKNDCEGDIEPGQNGNQHKWRAQAMSLDGQALGASYEWIVKEGAELFSLNKTDNQEVTATANPVDGRAALDIKAVSGADTEEEFISEFKVTNVICEELWPERVSGEMWLPFRDQENGFETYYCREQERGESLPLLGEPEALSASGDLRREYLLLVPGSSDAIGLRIYQNEEHLSPKDWYEKQPVSKGAPFDEKIDGYQALRDGRSLYINAANEALGSLYTNIYLISYNQDAKQDTQEIYNRLIKNLRFNFRLNGNDLRAALRRDTRRLSDLVSIKNLLESYKQNPDNKHCSITTIRLCGDNNECPLGESCEATYPLLSSGTYLPGMTTSRWPSWTSGLANELGQILPSDPLNNFAECPEGYNPATCWNESTLTFVCPVGSHTYQYRYLGNTFKLGSDFEYRNKHWQPAPPPELNLSGNCLDAPIIETGFCGDGRINTGEECDGQSAPSLVCYDSNGYRGSQNQSCVNCEWKIGGCQITEWCGDGRKNGNEECDGFAINGTCGRNCRILSCRRGFRNINGRCL